MGCGQVLPWALLHRAGGVNDLSGGRGRDKGRELLREEGSEGGTKEGSEGASEGDKGG